ncbi:hypothetical protein CDD83_11130 [Cordyceps sp. RAO-2017]|nr:hypothetical protein CDD83_11130 [Cordyceps sp. RAO-2017]
MAQPESRPPAGHDLRASVQKGPASAAAPARNATGPARPTTTPALKTAAVRPPGVSAGARKIGRGPGWSGRSPVRARTWVCGSRAVCLRRRTPLWARDVARMLRLVGPIKGPVVTWPAQETSLTYTHPSF